MSGDEQKNKKSSGITIISEGPPDFTPDETHAAQNAAKHPWDARVRSKQLLFILDNAPFGVVVNEGDAGEVVYKNPEMVRISGYQNPEATDVRSAVSAMTPDHVDIEAKMAALRRIEEAGGAIYLDEIVSKEGDHKIVEARAIVLPDKTRIAMWTDVTRREEAEKALRDVNADLENRVEERTAELKEINKKLRNEIKERNRVERELKRSREELRLLSEHLQRVSEEEKLRLSREVHDELGQLLSVMKIDASLISRNVPSSNSPLLEQAESFEKQIDGAIQAVRDICSRLRPTVLFHFGLSATIDWYLEDFQKRTGIECISQVDATLPLEDKELSVVLYRIFQESMTNILRHAEANKVTVSLSIKGENVVLSVKDNGRGITRDKMVKPQSFGIIGIRERVRFWGGTSTFEGSPGNGMAVTISIPLKNPSPPSQGLSMTNTEGDPSS
jgi:PAS domain S-box-containing protein